MGKAKTKKTKKKETKKKESKKKTTKIESKPKKAQGKTILVSELDIYDEYVTSKETETIESAAKAIAENQVENVIIINDKDEPIGSVSALDIVVKGLAEGLDASSSLSEIMSNIPVVEENASISEVFEEMDEYDSEFVAVTSKGKLVGCCTFKDLIMEDWTREDVAFKLVINKNDGTYDLIVE